MTDTVTHFSFVIRGVRLVGGFEPDSIIHGEYVSGVQCEPVGERSVIVSGEITSEDKNKNYLIAHDLKEFFLRLFSLYGVSCRVDNFKIDTTTDFLSGQIEVSPPVPLVEGVEVKNQAEHVMATFFDEQKTAEFYNLIESNNGIDMLHRFRSLFSIFDRLSPKNRNGHIDYHALKEVYAEEIAKRYVGVMASRYVDIVQSICQAHLVDIRAQKNYTDSLRQARERLTSGTLIDADVAFQLLKCIQIIRNKVNHGDFTGLDSRLVSRAYELLLPMVQRLLRV